MCGISGFWDRSRQSSVEELTRIGEHMREALAHRGPDSAGLWTNAEQGISLGHRRLSVIDLSVEGHQPMVSANGRFVLSYNGEIYNHAELREPLIQAGCRFRGHSDTEVLLEAIAHWGLRETLSRINGMFAFALWDNHERKLSLVRDRLGIKPLYYGWAGSVFLFASELKAMKRHPNFSPDIDRNALALFLENGYIPAPCCIYRGIQKLPPGHLLELKLEQSTSIETECYWSLKTIAETASRQPAKSVEEAQAAIARQIEEAVRIRLIADVPLGTFLSGGIDSSLVVAICQKVSPAPLKTFTIGFEEPDYNEAPYAQAVAKHLGIEPITQIVTAKEAQAVIPLVPTIYDEPFADSSQIPTYLVSKLAREHVTVCLSGDGGDELFGGYNRYEHIRRIYQKLAWCPAAVRKPLLSAYEILRNRLLRKRTEPGLAGQLAAVKTDQQFYALLNRHWKQGSRVVIDGSGEAAAFRPEKLWADLNTFTERMMAFDCLTYLPEDILCKVDRASMSRALEVRVPLLDYQLVELAWSLPIQQKVTAGVGKQPLRKLLAQHVPKGLFERPKTGFGIPLGDWLRGPLRDWAEDLLSAERLQREGWLHVQPVRQKWEQHLSGQCDWQYLIWNVLMFQAWQQESA